MLTIKLRHAHSRSLITLFGLLLVTYLMLLMMAGCMWNQSQEADVPPGFQFVEEVDLTAQSYDEQILGEFTLEETADMGIFYKLENIDSPFFDLSLAGSNDDRLVILHSEDFRTDSEGGGLWKQNLPPDVYRLVLTAHQSPGELSIYWKH